MPLSALDGPYGIGTMGKRYAVMIDRGMIEGMSLAAVC